VKNPQTVPGQTSQECDPEIWPSKLTIDRKMKGIAQKIGIQIME